MHLNLGVVHSDRSMPLIEGSVSSRHFDYSVTVDRPGVLFLGMLQDRRFDVSEMSLASYVIRRSRGFDDLLALPAFPSRGFPHHTIYARKEAIGGNLGRTVRAIGAPEYQMTAAVWAREILERELGIRLADASWVTGALEGGRRIERVPLPERLSRLVQNDVSGRGLVRLLTAGEIDLLVSPTVPSAMTDVDHPLVGRLLPDFAEREIAFYQRTRVFPILHTVVVRSDLLKTAPWLGSALFSLFSDAKELAVRRLTQTDTYASSLAWLPAAIEFHRTTLGDQLWPYGLDENRLVLDAFLSACRRQALLEQDLSVEELFPNIGSLG